MKNQLSGQTFGLLTVLDEPSVSGKVACRCTCGGMKWVRPSNLRSGKTKSCGCLRGQVQASGSSSPKKPKVKITVEQYKRLREDMYELARCVFDARAHLRDVVSRVHYLPEACQVLSDAIHDVCVAQGECGVWCLSHPEYAHFYQEFMEQFDRERQAYDRACALFASRPSLKQVVDDNGRPVRDANDKFVWYDPAAGEAGTDDTSASASAASATVSSAPLIGV